MEIITIRATATALEVVDGRVKRSRLKYRAPGLEIYLIGSVSVPRRAAVNHLAMECALARHIPLMSLKSDGWV
jgi:hypothetical protein